MAVTLITTTKRFEGTAAEMAAVSVVGVPAGSTFFQSDTGLTYNLSSAGTWNPEKAYLPDDAATETTLTEIKVFDGGVATGGSKITIIDTTKNFETNMFSGHMAKVTISNIDYYRTVASNTANTLTINALPGAAASVIVGTPGTAEVTVTYVNEGIGGNSLTAEVVAAPGDNDNLSASLTGTVLTIYLGKTGGVLDDAKNTATLVAAKIDELAEFTAAMTGTGGVVPVAAAVTFTGGVAVVDVTAGSEYQIMRKTVISDGGGSVTVDQTTHDNLNTNANLQVGNADVATANPVPTVLTGSYVSVDAVIALNGTLSSEIDFQKYKYLSFLMPSEWTAATLTIKGSAVAGGTKRIIKNDVGITFAPMTVAVDEIYTIDVQSLMLSGVFFLSLESSVAQAAARTIKVMLKA